MSVNASTYDQTAMTLNVSLLADGYVVQASDRRLTRINHRNQIELVEDNANKAIVLCCADGQVAITYTGLGSCRGTRVDEWVVDTPQDHGLCELPLETAVHQFSEIATNWFASFRTVWLWQRR
jgi:hypothetical protein